MYNPENNFAPTLSDMTEDAVWAWKRSKTFFIRTVTFDLAATGWGSVITNGYVESEVNTWLDSLSNIPFSSLNSSHFVGVDDYPWNDIFPLLKCQAPCYTCLESNPEYCLSCWGPKA
jgi:hypothetical protein